jgi:hypothetical protein
VDGPGCCESREGGDGQDADQDGHEAPCQHDGWIVGGRR